MGKKEEKFNDYDGFVEKFKPKKTTDDCYTPPCVYDAVLDWVKRNADIKDRPVVRPFWPGADYTKTDYPDGCVVIDNPPFSILAQILRYYEGRNIHYFLFSPHLTLFSNAKDGRTFVVAGAQITYDNGAIISTGFTTNLPDFSDYYVIGCPELQQAIKEAQSKNREEKKKEGELPVYSYPDNIVTASKVKNLVDVGLQLLIKRESAVEITRLDAQKPLHKHIFGKAILVSDTTAEKLKEKTSKIGGLKVEKLKAEKLKAERLKEEKMKKAIRFELSEAEREIVEKLNENERRHREDTEAENQGGGEVGA